MMITIGTGLKEGNLKNGTYDDDDINEDADDDIDDDADDDIDDDAGHGGNCGDDDKFKRRQPVEGPLSLGHIHSVL